MVEHVLAFYWPEVNNKFSGHVNMEDKPKANTAAQHVLNIGVKHDVNICLERKVKSSVTNCMSNA